MIKPRIEKLSEKKCIGIKISNSWAKDKTGELWKSFMPRRNEIEAISRNEFISLQIYGKNFDFQPESEFEKWALIAVSNYSKIPKGMDALTIDEGLYAVFDYKGSSADTSIFQYIYSQWLPNSIYELDHRPHFEVLGEKYKNNDPNSEEEIWIPIKSRQSR